MNKYLLALLLLISSDYALSQPLVSFAQVVSGLSKPVDVEEVNDNSHRLFIVEQTGKIRIWNGTSLLPTPFLDIGPLITTLDPEQGLLSLAFHPKYISNGYFYIYYTDKSGKITIARYTRSTADVADSLSGVVLMTIPKPYSNHNGGNLVFGPDTYLYFGTGDGGSAGDPLNNAQDDTSLLGKMLRIDVNNPLPPYYSIPASNPFAGSSTAKQEIISKGLRNPWRWSFDKQTGDMWIADVGQNAWEEVNFVKSDSVLYKNFGWHCYEGNHIYGSGCPAQPNNVFPVFEYPHNDAMGGYSISGGYVYRGTEYASLQGYYICADYLSYNGWLIKKDGSGWNSTMQTNWPANISSFGERSDGTLYALTHTGTLYKVVADNPLPLHLVSFNGKETGNKFEIYWHAESEETGDTYIIEKRANLSEPFVEITRMTAASDRSSGDYSIKIPLTPGYAYYRLKIILKNGQVIYSRVISSEGINRQILRTFITGTNLMCKLPAGTASVEILDAVGKLLLKQETDPAAKQVNILLTNIARGIITVRALTDNGWQIARVLY